MTNTSEQTTAPSRKVSRSIATRLEAADLCLSNALIDTEIMAALAGFGYDAARLHYGKTLLENAQSRYHEQRETYGQLAVLNNERAESFQQAEQNYTTCISLCRLIFKHDEAAYQQLHLRDARKTTWADWLAQARFFYGIALSNPVLLGRMNEHGFGQSKLETYKQQLEDLAQHQYSRQAQRGNARNATALRDTAMLDLDTWMNTFRAVARMALRGRPQLLAKINVSPGRV